MALVAMVTDTHAGVRSDNPAFHQYQKKCWEWFFEHIDQKQIKHVIHLGDIYDRRKYINFMSAKRLREDFFEPLRQRNIETHIVCGNHDQFFKNTHEVNALDEIIGDRYTNIKTYLTPEIVNVDGLDIQLMPWITDSNREQALDAIINPRAEILMGHLELSGFQMHKGMISEHGMDGGTFEKFDRVYSGHYHHRSTVGNISYIGALAQYTWSDHNDPRGFSIFDTETRFLEFIENPNVIFRMAKYDDVKNPDIVDKIQNTDFTKYRDTYVKLVVVNKQNPSAFDLLFDSIYKAGPLDIDIVEDASYLLSEEEEVDVDQVEDTSTILRKYIDKMSLPVDNDRMKKFMFDVYQEALQAET